MRTQVSAKSHKKIDPANGSMNSAAEEKQEDKQPAAARVEAKVEATVENLLPPGSMRRVVAGVAAAAVGGLWAAAWVGAGPAAIAGTAGYLAYRKLHNERKIEPLKH